MQKERFEELEHTADVAVRIWGRDLAELFANAAYALACQLAEVESVAVTAEEQIELEAADTETLLVAWLGELVYLYERDGHVFVACEVQEITPTHLRAVVRGGPATEHRRYVKGVTFHNLRILCTESGCEATVVFDV